MEAGAGGYPGTRFTEQEILNLVFGPHEGLVSGVKALTDASAVQIASDTDCRWVDISAIGGPLAVGDSSVVVTSGSERGVILYPGNLPYRFYVQNLNQVHVAGANGRKACFVYRPA